MRVKKIGLVGNSCTGKTTTAFSLIREFKFLKKKTGYVNDICRFVSWDPELFDTEPATRLNVLFRQMANECENAVRKDVEYLVTERTALDWYLYYKWTCRNVGIEHSDSVSALVCDWLSTYDLLLYMDSTSMEYINDGYRPSSTQIRDEIDQSYRLAFRSILEGRPNVLHIRSSEIQDRCIEAVSKVMTYYGLDHDYGDS